MANFKFSSIFKGKRLFITISVVILLFLSILFVSDLATKSQAQEKAKVAVDAFQIYNKSLERILQESPVSPVSLKQLKEEEDTLNKAVDNLDMPLLTDVKYDLKNYIETAQDLVSIYSGGTQFNSGILLKAQKEFGVISSSINSASQYMTASNYNPGKASAVISSNIAALETLTTELENRIVSSEYSTLKTGFVNMLKAEIQTMREVKQAIDTKNEAAATSALNRSAANQQKFESEFGSEFQRVSEKGGASYEELEKQLLKLMQDYEKLYQ